MCQEQETHHGLPWLGRGPPAVVLASPTGGKPNSVFRDTNGPDNDITMALRKCLIRVPCAIDTSTSPLLKFQLEEPIRQRVFGTLWLGPIQSPLEPSSISTTSTRVAGHCFR
jgi:hypothetical protein